MIAQLFAAAVLAAAPTPLLDAPRAQGVAVAGDQVVVTRGGPSGRLRVDALPVAGGPAHRLLTTPKLGPRWTAVSSVSASPERVAVLAGFEKFVDHGPNVSRWRLYTGPLAGPLRVAVSAGGRNWQRRWLPLGAAVGGDRVLLHEARLEPFGARLTLLAPGAPPRRLHWAHALLPPFALAGERVAYVAGGFRRVVVADLQSGAQQVSMKVDETGSVDLRADGTVVADGLRGLVTAAPGSPRTRIPGSATLHGAKFAGTRVAAIERAPDGALRPAVLDPGATAPRPVGVVTGDLPVLDADERGVAWLANGCVLYAPLDAVAPAEPPAGPCPRVEVGFEEHDQVLRGRRLRVDVDCVIAPASGCNGTVILRIRGLAGRGRFHVESGRHGIATVRLPRRAARIVRHRVETGDGAALRMTWRVPDSRPQRFKTVFVVASVS